MNSLASMWPEALYTYDNNNEDVNPDIDNTINDAAAARLHKLR